MSCLVLQVLTAKVKVADDADAETVEGVLSTVLDIALRHDQCQFCGTPGSGEGVCESAPVQLE